MEKVMKKRKDGLADKVKSDLISALEKIRENVK